MLFKNEYFIIMNKFSELVKIGTCSWKYPSWKGILYSNDVGSNYLSEYAKHYTTVEIDQWFWSLFAGNKVVLPKPEVVSNYIASVPSHFQFSVKVTNAITLTHHYSRNKNTPLVTNPFFLSNDVFFEFLKLLHPMKDYLGAFIFQFEYLNKQKMQSQMAFQEKFSTFIEKCPPSFNYCLETRNPNYLNEKYFHFLKSVNLSHVFLQGYYMPSIFDLYEKYHDLIERFSVIRLIGTDRKGIEKKSRGIWNQLWEPKDEELNRLEIMIDDLLSKEVRLMINVNNHYEGSAPLTIERLINHF